MSTEEEKQKTKKIIVIVVAVIISIVFFIAIVMLAKSKPEAPKVKYIYESGADVPAELLPSLYSTLTE